MKKISWIEYFSSLLNSRPDIFCWHFHECYAILISSRFISCAWDCFRFGYDFEALRLKSSADEKKQQHWNESRNPICKYFDVHWLIRSAASTFCMPDQLHVTSHQLREFNLHDLSQWHYIRLNWYLVWFILEWYGN